MTSIDAGCDDRLVSDAISLIRRAWALYDKDYIAGCMSCAVYDTAWVSMVIKNDSNGKRWLFPESFDYLISTQSDDGSWKSGTPSHVDGILNTAASLLSLQRHRLEPLNTTSHALENIDGRIHLAASSLASQLKEWDVAETAHVGFEIIVPSLLQLLRAEDSSTNFEFDGGEVLQQIHGAKMSRFKPEMLYGPEASTAIHSLEAFIGKIDFDRLAHHKTNGSMMASPSSTAAYLIHASEWDEEAEVYLRRVIAEGAGKGSGSVPSAFPSAFFECTWIFSTMLSAGFSKVELGCNETEEMMTTLHLAFNNLRGLLGFAPGLPPDVDDTAQCIVCLNKFGRDALPEGMIKAFEAKTHFRTYASERNPSFTANCNVLSALLAQPNTTHYTNQILKVVEFLCNYWWENDGNIKDKWNVSHLYASLLAFQSITELLVQIENGKLEALSPNLQSKVNITLFQICFRALLETPNPHSIETTSYRVLILCKARRLPFFRPIRSYIDHDITLQVRLLRETSQTEIDSVTNHVWIEKVSYGSTLLTQGYKLAALKAASGCTDEIPLSSASIPDSSFEKGTAYVKLLQRTPLFESTPEWQVQASMLEASLFQPLLRNHRLNVFPRKNMAPDKYFDLIPLTWISCNNRTKAFASNHFLFEMMIISFLDFQADEFMEAVAGPAFKGQMDQLHRLIDDVCNTVESSLFTTPKRIKTSGQISNRDAEVQQLNTFPDQLFHKSNDHISEPSPCENEVYEILIQFVRHISNHPSVQSASRWDRTSTLRELRIYLHAHAKQSEDNDRLAQTRTQQLNGKSVSSRTRIQDSYFRWVSTTSADHTACTYSFAFAGCLLSTQSNGTETFSTTKTKYLAAAMCQHLASMCRMYNDYGSIARDKAECNLNSIDFDDFLGNDTNVKATTQTRKDTLFELAQCERSWFNATMERLGNEMKGSRNQRHMHILNMFCEVTDLYGQIYMVKDIASRMKADVNGTK
ncbi:aphidicolan-16beta-ol synthase [Periconia macrospinosa]|uniref:Aphidicolan-16beta-ol synthase n=1 Tax=Periconia macrospinosa TaxID=97972 RepID=A0A2V1E573_9PLEO|nr:aphidicolan-16beta-ol synthase [Periconia macrospinosa]